MKNTDVVILSAARTAVGSFGGTLASVHPADMGAAAVKEALKRGNVDPAQVDEVLLGCVLQAGLGQNIARQVSLKAGIALEVPTTTVNKVCGSGLKTVNMAAQAILAGDAEIIVAGGVESMSMAPYLLPNARYGYRMGDGKTIDAMVHDGLWCAFNQYHMGITAENVAAKWGISREEQDKFAVSSQNKAEKAILENRFADEIIPFEIQSKKGTTIFDTDEFVKKGVTFEQLSKLKPAFKKDGTVTAGNASGINDGAAAIIVTTAKKAEELGVKPLARYVAQASAGLDPAIMGVGPIYATRKVLQKTGWTISDLDLIEANEAFAAQSCAVAKDLEFDMSKVNVNGGAIAIGHPIGASGARIFITLLYEMQKRDAKKGLATLCIGGGQGISTLVER